MIHAQNLTKFYGATRALESVSFRVPRGQIVGFLGPNGAGKTTCMKILTGFISPTDGTAAMGGHDVVDDSLAARSSVGYLPEESPLYLDMDAISYLRLVAELRDIPRAEHDQCIRTVAEQCGLREVAGKTLGTLSKGFRQRVGLAQALVHTPDILILDEPTVGLDPNQVEDVRDVIRRVGQNRTVMLSTHYLTEVEEVCDRVIIINHGKVVLDQELVGDPKLHVTVLAGSDEAAPGAIREAIAGLDGVGEVSPTTSEGRSHGFTVAPANGVDVRPEIFKLTVRKQWQLIEMRSKGMDLKRTFREVTQ
jgi:ABC-2 type transport system ATP-binding protein